MAMIKITIINGGVIQKWLELTKPSIDLRTTTSIYNHKNNYNNHNRYKNNNINRRISKLIVNKVNVWNSFMINRGTRMGYSTI